MKTINLIHPRSSVSSRLDKILKTHTYTHKIKLFKAKNKENILKAVERKRLDHTEKNHSKSNSNRKKWRPEATVITYSKDKRIKKTKMEHTHKCQLRIPYTTRLSFKNESENKSFQDIQRLRASLVSRPTL